MKIWLGYQVCLCQRVRINLQHVLFNERENRVVRKTVEECWGRDPISTRVFEDKPVAAFHFRQLNILDNDVMWITSASPNDAVLHRLARIAFQWLSYDGNFVGWIHVEALINSVGNVIMNGFYASLVDFNVLRVHIGQEGESLFREERSRFRNYFHFIFVGKIFLQALIDGLGDASLRKWIFIKLINKLSYNPYNCHSLAARKTTTDIQQVHVLESQRLSILESSGWVFDRLRKNFVLQASHTDMKSNALDVQSQLLGSAKQELAMLTRHASKLFAKADLVCCFRVEAQTKKQSKNMLFQL